MSQVKAGIFPLIIVNMNGDILKQVERPPVGGLEVLQIGGQDVVGFPGGNAHGEFTVMVGIEFPLGLLVFGAADFYEYAVDWAVVRTPDRSRDQSVGLVVGSLGCMQAFLKAETGQEQKNYQETGNAQVQSPRSRIRNSHRLRFLPPLLPLRSLPRPLSIRADW